MKLISFFIAFVALCLALVTIRPELAAGRRFVREFPFWGPESEPILKPLSILASMPIRSRLDKTWNEKGETKYYRHTPERDGHATSDVPLNLKIGWRYPDLNIGMHGASKATPAIDETGIYVGGDSGWFFAFNFDGTLKWKFHIDGSLRGIHSTAILHRGRVCFGGYNGSYYCLDKANGDVVWTLAAPKGGFGASPLVIGDDMYATIETSGPVNAYVAKIALYDGEVEWQSDWLGEQSHTSPAYDKELDSLYVGANNGIFFRIAASNGDVKWRRDLRGPTKGTALINDGHIFISSWSSKFYCLDAITGRTQWAVNLAGKSQSSATLFSKAGKIVVGDSLGGINGIDVSTGQIVWSHYFDRPTMSSALAAVPPGAKSEVAWIACGKNRLCALDPNDGRILSNIELPGSLTGQPIDFRGNLYVALDYPGGLVQLIPAVKK